MELKKDKNAFNMYSAKMSYGEIAALYDLTQSGSGAMIDELRSNFEWVIKRLPEPGEDEKKEPAYEPRAAVEELDELPSPEGEAPAEDVDVDLPTPGGEEDIRVSTREEPADELPEPFPERRP